MLTVVNELARSPKPQKKIRLGLDGAEKLTVLNERVVKIGREHTEQSSIRLSTPASFSNNIKVEGFCP